MNLVFGLGFELRLGLGLTLRLRVGLGLGFRVRGMGLVSQSISQPKLIFMAPYVVFESGGALRAAWLELVSIGYLKQFVL